jgi:hypothetical protein
MLEAMFSGRHPITKDKKGRAFLDRDPRTFEHVLNFLRTGLQPVKLDAMRLEMFEAEVNYLQLATETSGAELKPPTEPLKWAANPAVRLLDDGRSVKKLGPEKGWDCNVLATRGFSSGVHKWSLHLDGQESPGCCVVVVFCCGVSLKPSLGP